MINQEDIQDKGIQQEPETSASVETAGQKLAAAREGFGISVQEVAKSLNLSVAIIEAIEADDYDSLPGSTFARGYIRTYANLLRLDPDELVVMLDVTPIRMMEIPSGRGATRFRMKSRGMRKKRGFLSKFLVFVMTLALIVVALFGLYERFHADLEKFIPPISVFDAGDE